MARAAFNVAVFPYHKAKDGEFEYALLKRADAGFWQGVSGGGEGDETPLEAAKRETFEETGIPPDALVLQLDTVEPIPVIEFSVGNLWGEDVYVIPQYWFGVLADGKSLELSREHTAYRWLAYQEAHRLLKYDGNKTALWELNQRLRGQGPRG
jgi:dATP pyrophosphohydrolase